MVDCSILEASLLAGGSLVAHSSAAGEIPGICASYRVQNGWIYCATGRFPNNCLKNNHCLKRKPQIWLLARFCIASSFSSSIALSRMSGNSSVNWDTFIGTSLCFLTRVVWGSWIGLHDTLLRFVSIKLHEGSSSVSTHASDGLCGTCFFAKQKHG